MRQWTSPKGRVRGLSRPDDLTGRSASSLCLVRYLSFARKEINLPIPILSGGVSRFMLVSKCPIYNSTP